MVRVSIPPLKDPKASLPPLDLFKPSDLKLPKVLEEELGMSSEKKCTQLNAAYEALFQKHEKITQKHIDKFQKLEDLQTAFLEAKDYLKRLVDPSLWQTYRAEVPEDMQRYVEVHTSGSPCQFQISIQRLAQNRISVKTSNFSLGGAEEATGLPHGELKINDKIFRITEAVSLHALLEEINAACTGVLRLQLLEVSPAGESSGTYRIFAEVLNGEKPYISDDAEGNILRALGFEVRERNDRCFAKIKHKQKSAKFSINGVAMERDTNDIENAFKGVRLTLKEKTPRSTEVSVQVRFERGVVKALLLGFAKAFTQYQEVLGKHAPLTPGASGPLTRFTFLRAFFNDFQHLCAELQDKKTQSMFGIKKMAGVYVMDEAAFEEASLDAERMKSIFIGRPVDGWPQGGRVQAFFKSLGQLEDSFKKALEDVEKDIRKQHGNVISLQGKIDREKAKMQKALPKLQEAAMKADLLKKLNEQMLHAQFGSSDEKK